MKLKFDDMRGREIKRWIPLSNRRLIKSFMAINRWHSFQRSGGKYERQYLIIVFDALLFYANRKKRIIFVNIHKQQWGGLFIVYLRLYIKFETFIRFRQA